MRVKVQRRRRIGVRRRAGGGPGSCGRRGIPCLREDREVDRVYRQEDGSELGIRVRLEVKRQVLASHLKDHVTVHIHLRDNKDYYGRDYHLNECIICAF